MDQMLSGYYDELWNDFQLGREIVGAACATATPLDFCLSTVARIREQRNPPLAALAAIEGTIAKAGIDATPYPLESLHVTVLGCTQRAENTRVFNTDRIKRTFEACRSVLAGLSPLRVVFRGVGVLGPKVFAQGFPIGQPWGKIRKALYETLISVGEQPLYYGDHDAVHLNVLIVEDDQRRLIAPLAGLRDYYIGEVTVDVIEYFSADRVLSPQNSRCLGRLVLSEQCVDAPAPPL